ncbi:MAG: hypothetical protein Q9159_003753 [Coniocarpon cinnabarinum]
MANLYIAIYRPHYGNFEHWGLCMEHDGEFTTFEVEGQHPEFVKNTHQGDPSNDERHLESIFVACIRKSDASSVKQAFDDANVDNETTEWNCQDFVLEMLAVLRDVEIVDEDDEEYETGRQEALDKHFGPM